MMLSPEHRVVYTHPSLGCTNVLSAQDVMDAHTRLKQGFKGRVPAAFMLKPSTQLDMSDAQLRLMVAVIADGHYQNRAPSTRVQVRVKKQRKKGRMRALLKAAGVAFLERSNDYPSAMGYTVFTFTTPVRAKDYSGFWRASPAQLRVIVDEAKHWDGSLRIGARLPAFSTRNRASADFMQYAHTALGTRTSIHMHQRNRDRTIAGEVYHDEGVDMTVAPSAGGAFVTMSSNSSSKNDNAVEVPAPGGMKYCFEVPSSFLVLRRNDSIFCTGNTGKTISVVWALDYLIRAGRIKRALVVAPLSLLEDTWQREFTNGAPHMTTAVLHGTAAKRKKLAAMGHQVHIINYDGIETVYDQLVANKYDVVVYDESTNIKNINRRWKFCRGVSADAAWVWMLTATPTAQSPTDAYGQCRMLLGTGFPYTQQAWKETTMRQATQFKWVSRPEATQKVNEWMQPAIYVRKRDVMQDLPAVMKYRRKVNLSSQQTQMLDELKRKASIALDDGGTVTAVHGAALAQKVCQIASGCVYDDNHAVVVLDNAPRLAELYNIVETTRARHDPSCAPNNKVIVFCAFKHTVNVVAQALRDKGWDVAVVTGDTPSALRTQSFSAFQRTVTHDVLVATPDVAAHGLTLTAATTTVWFTPHTRAELYQQANNRTDRPGQKFPMEIHELYGSPAEKVLYDRLDDRASEMHMTLQAYKQLVHSL
jgi:superfamily II DNA or RNA helicase